MSFLETIEKNVFLWNANNSGMEPFFVDWVLRKYEEILPCVGRLNQPIREEKDLFYHFFKISMSYVAKKISELSIDDSDKQKFQRLNDSLAIDNGSFCKYINANSKDLFANIDVRQNEAKKISIRCMREALSLYSSSISDEVVEDILNHCKLYLLSDFHRFPLYFKKHQEQFVRIFEGIDEVSLYEVSPYLRFFLRLDKSKELEKKARPFAEHLCARFLPILSEKAKDPDDKDIYQHFELFKDFYNIARKYRMPCANAYRSLEETYLIAVNDYVRKHALETKTNTFSLEPAIKILKGSKDQLKFLQLTIKYDTKADKANFLYDRIFESENTGSPFTDLADRIDAPSSEAFPYHTQDMLHIDESVQMWLMNYIVLDEQLSHEFADYMPLVAGDVDQKLLDGKGDLAFETAGSIEILFNIIRLYETKQHETPLYQALINGLCENVLNTIEKTLRMLTLKECYSTEFFEEKDLTLGQMLSQGRPLSLSKSLRQLLQFHLDVDKSVEAFDQRPGRNLRNIHMHNLDHKYRRTNYGDCLWLIFLLMAIFNELVMFSYEKQKNAEAKP